MVINSDILILGSGYITRNILKNLDSGNYRTVSVLGRSNKPHWFPVSDSICYYQCELKNIEEIIALIVRLNITAIIHSACSLIPTSDTDDFLKEKIEIIEPSVELFSRCAQLGIYVVFISSGGTIYGNSSVDGCFRETDLIKPMSFYGLSKALLETQLQFFMRKYDSGFCIIRPSNVYAGVGSLKPGQGIIPIVFQRLQSEEIIEIWGDGQAVRDYLHVDDLVEVLILVINSNPKDLILNVGSGYGSSTVSVVQKIASLLGAEAQIKYIDNDFSGVNKVVLNISRLQELFSVKPRSLDEGLKELIRQGCHE